MRSYRPYLPKNTSAQPKKDRTYVATGKAHHRVAIPRGEHEGIFALARELTEAQIRKVRAHAVTHKLYPLMFACDRALRGSERARVAIARWYLTGRAASR
jgi:hypothetical protein